MKRPEAGEDVGLSFGVPSWDVQPAVIHDLPFAGQIAWQVLPQEMQVGWHFWSSLVIMSYRIRHRQRSDADPCSDLGTLAFWRDLYRPMYRKERQPVACLREGWDLFMKWLLDLCAKCQLICSCNGICLWLCICRLISWILLIVIFLSCGWCDVSTVRLQIAQRVMPDRLASRYHWKEHARHLQAGGPQCPTSS